MSNPVIGIRVRVQNPMSSEEGQDLVEYSLAFSVIGLGTAAALQSVAAQVVVVFNTIAAIYTSHFSS